MFDRNGTFTWLGNTSAIFMNTRGMLNKSPRMKPMVRFLVRNEATMPIDSMAKPVSQYPR